MTGPTKSMAISFFTTAWLCRVVVMLVAAISSRGPERTTLR